ncbi:MAG TPA: sigma-54 dependent transcriptional regulator [Candidatus Binataceae bacterium]|nr:sigma-54 dependent transcriptional regulator [Candidatus Binataceae bacterium]
MEKRILVAEDDRTTRDAWSELIVAWGYKVKTAENGEAALTEAASYDPHILLLDLNLPRKNGLQVLQELNERGLRIPTIVISGQGEIPDVVKTIKLGAYDYLRKPVDPAHLRVMLTNLAAHITVAEENERLRRRLMEAGKLGPMIGQSRAMQQVMVLIKQVAPTSASVLIRGESGTGKEVVARTIHELSPRAQGPFVAINCAALPENLMESELFGHERGAFTGADRRREGCFELANGGTLLLDEIAEMKVELQAKLLRVLEAGTLRRVGGTVDVPLDVRVLAATNRNVENAIHEGRFREDLYYRLNVLSIELPTLDRRRDDIPLLVDHFIRELAPQMPTDIRAADNECLEALKTRRWPGNIRQLRNVIERALVVSQGPLITVRDLPPETPTQAGSTPSFEVHLGRSIEEVEQDLILRTIDLTEGNKARAAEILGISLKTLYNRLEKYQSDPRSSKPA